jgi:xanthine dehydrogenase accessory factor
VHTQDFEVLQHARQWCESDSAPWLCTIVAATGSSPRPVGSMLVASPDGQQVGSVSGGCVEEDLLERLRAGEFDPQRIHLRDYGVSPEENERLGLPCGGRLTILLQALTLSDCPWLDKILAALADRQCIERQLDLESGQTLLVSRKQFADLSLASSTLRQSFGPQMRMLLVGAGQLAQSLSELALAMDYEVMVTDTRQLMLSQWEGPDVPLLQGMPDDIVREHASDRRSVIITLTHDPRIDDMALMEALGTEAWYVGALGSMRTTAARLERLRQLDIPQEQIDRLYAPVGLDIGSKTPHEIAISIMAQLVQLRRSSH